MNSLFTEVMSKVFMLHFPGRLPAPAAFQDGRAYCTEQPKKHVHLIVLCELSLTQHYAADMTDLDFNVS